MGTPFAGPNSDLRTPEQILTHLDLTGTLDLDQPVALLLVAVLQPHCAAVSCGDAWLAGSAPVAVHTLAFLILRRISA
jgi:hypothetical protein